MNTSERVAFQEKIKELNLNFESEKNENTARKIEIAILRRRINELKELMSETAKTATIL